MRIAVVGAGAMGGSYGALLHRAGHEVRLVDTRLEHVAAIERDGLHVGGAFGEVVVRVPVSASPEYWDWAEWVIAFTDSNATAEAAVTIDRVMAPRGCAVTFQNGIGNVETLVAHLGKDRVCGGSSMCSAAVDGPGRVVLTNRGPTSLGEIDGDNSERVNALADALRGAGFEVRLDADVMTTIWTKFLVNCGINAICAVTGLRAGEMTRVPEVYRFHERVIDEALAVTAAKGISLPDPEFASSIKKAAHYRFNRPSMLQHVDAGRRTEIDAINGALVREARQLGIATPANEALVALLKGRELARIRAVHEPDLDYAAWEARIQDEPLPG